jgi:hypothetical protein
MWGVKILDGQSVQDFQKGEFEAFRPATYVGIEQRCLIPGTKSRVVAVVVEGEFVSGSRTEAFFDKFERLSGKELRSRIDKIIKKYGEPQPMNTAETDGVLGDDRAQVELVGRDTAYKRLQAYRAAQQKLEELSSN